jgi:excisionase family DNA binding protein
MLEHGRRRKPGPGRPARRTPDARSQERAAPRVPKPSPPSATEVEDDGLVGLREAAAALGMSEDWTRELAEAGRIPAERDAGGRWRFSIARLKLVVNAWRTASAYGRRPPTLSRPRRSR